MNVHFHIWSIKANGIESSSAMNIGTNLLIGFASSSKSLQGNGQVSGDHADLPTLFNYIDDQDTVDTPFWENSPGGCS